MPRHSIEIERNEFGNFSRNTLGTDALNAIASIPGTNDVQIDKEAGHIVTISFTWIGREDFDDTAAVLAKHHCKRLGC